VIEDEDLDNHNEVTNMRSEAEIREFLGQCHKMFPARETFYIRKWLKWVLGENK
jgi:hypothetical protein